MDTHSAGNVTSVVIEMEPGKVFVKVADPKLPAHRIEFFLRRAVEDWFKARPSFVIDRSEAIADQGEILGLRAGRRRYGEDETPDMAGIPGDSVLRHAHRRKLVFANVSDVAHQATSDGRWESPCLIHAL